MDLVKKITNSARGRAKAWRVKKTETELRKLEEEELPDGNQCLICLRDAEEAVESNRWKSEPNEFRKMWYQIVNDENQAIVKIIARIEPKPKQILEIGCGPGRVIDQILKISQEEKFHIERIVGLEQNEDIYQYANSRFLKSHPRTVHITKHLYGDDGTLSPYFNENEFDLALVVSNLVGWQEEEVKWISEILRVARTFFFTLYKKGFEDQRKRMYESLCGRARIDENKDVWIEVVEAFNRKSCKSGSYTLSDIQGIISKVKRVFPNSSAEEISVGDYMFGFLISKSESVTSSKR